MAVLPTHLPHRHATDDRVCDAHCDCLCAPLLAFRFGVNVGRERERHGVHHLIAIGALVVKRGLATRLANINVAAKDVTALALEDGVARQLVTDVTIPGNERLYQFLVVEVKVVRNGNVRVFPSIVVGRGGRWVLSV